MQFAEKYKNINLSQKVKTLFASHITWEKFIGKIKHYYSNINVGLIKLNNGPLRVGDDILIIGLYNIKKLK